MEVTQKWVNLALLIAGAILFLFLNQLTVFVWDLGRWPMPQGWIVEPNYVLSFLVAAGAAGVARRHPRVNLFLNEVAQELSKVTWPARKETVASTGVVAVLVAIAAVILFLVDALWGTAARGLL